jgi:chemotaxis protein methyltransferase CheR
MEREVLLPELGQLSSFVAEVMGLHFPPPRWNDLQRGLAATSQELGFATPSECARRFLSGGIARTQIETLANHLTVGETYFLREPKSFEMLAKRVIPEFIQHRKDRRLRIWSAACCTGEEAYSIAIVLLQSIPDLEDWNITLLATDINSRFLCKAAAGIYGNWSFRQAPDGFRERFFRPVGKEQWEVLPQIKRLVRFGPLNLVEDFYPALTNDTNAMDVVFCRNVLMYFTPQQARKVVENLYRAQIDGGWLITGSGELSQLSSAPYVATTLQGVTYYRKTEIAESSHSRHVAEHSASVAPLIPHIDPVPMKPEHRVEAPPAPDNHAKLRRAARRLANRGKLAEALECCDHWIAGDRLNPSAHYLRAIILQERGEIADAVSSLRAALYLDPNFVLVHFALGNIERNRGRRRAAEKHLQNARQLLEAYGPDDCVPESEGVTVSRFTEIVDSLLEMEAAV